jgi:hypothetical protein
MRPSATSVCSLQLLVFAVFSYYIGSLAAAEGRRCRPQM